jgi:hypothetical protein
MTDTAKSRAPKSPFKIGDFVKLEKPFNIVPCGKVDALAMNGDAAYVDGRAIATYVLDLVEFPTDEQGSAST